MIGGYQILDLRSIDLQKSGSASSITDPYVLKQLLMFRDHIDKAYNFSKPLVNQLKPVLIRFRDKKSGEKTEGATFGELSVDGNYYTFKVTARISGALVLRINVAFEEITNDYGNKEWVIDTATIQLKDESKTISGDLELTGDLSVGDDASIVGDASVGGDLTIVGNIIGDNTSKQWDGSLVSVEGLEYTGVFCKAVRNFNEIQFIMNFRAANTTDSTISIGSDSRRCVFANLGNDIYSKIYAHNGQKVSELTTSESIAYSSLFISNTNGSWSSANMPRFINLIYINGVGLAFYNEGGAITISAGQSLDFEARISLAIN